MFVARRGFDRLPDVFFLGAILDVIAASLYVMVSRKRSVAGVWQVALVLYSASLAGVWMGTTDGSLAGTYALYVVHSTSMTILILHWGLFILDAFDASQARRLFPFLFAVGRMGALVGSGAVATLSASLGAANLLWASAGLALVAALLSRLGSVRGNRPNAYVASSPDESAADDDTSADPSSPLSAWRQALASPLVRAIAISVATMVLVRHGLRDGLHG